MEVDQTSESDPVLAWFEEFAPRYDDEAGKIDESAAFMDTLTQPLISRGTLVLDIGIGTGLSSQNFAAAGATVDGIDESKNMLAVCTQKGFARNLVLQDINQHQQLPFDNGSYDLVVSNAVVNFIPDLEKFLSEAGRVLRPNGWLCFSFEEPFGEEGIDYLRREDGSLIAKDVFDKRGVIARLRKLAEVDILLVQSGFKNVSMKRHFAFQSPNTGRNVFFLFAKAQKANS